ncbi:MAG TPA: hypothetical protein P5205_10485 [Candidatus Paceibacterota bacterium]|nr:hypothetical protein [Verrucomicrobiota bacterium]HSA10782.1 hypothetical protein [Candidatus Paceibacterota bacterium]
MTASSVLNIVCLLAPLAAGADTLDVYGSLTGKTVLLSSAVSAPSYSLVPDPLNDRTNAIAAIERALSEKGTEVVQDGPHFVRLFPKSARDLMTNAPLRGAALATATAQKDQEAFPTGTIDFSGADLRSVLDIYAALRQRTILRSATLRGPVIRLKSTCPLTREEALYALETVLALNGISVVDDGAKFVQVAPIPQRAETRAPKPESDAKLFDPKEVPAVIDSGPPGLPIPSKPLTDIERLEQELVRLKKAVYDFMHITEPNKRSPQRLLELYARLANKTALASTNFDQVPIYFHVETPLTRSELLYAIETTFTLHNLAVVPVGERKIRLGRISETLRNNRGKPERMRLKSAE